MFDLAIIGDTSLDEFLIIDQPEADLHCYKNKLELCLAFGKKIPIKRKYYFFGGNAYNVAVGAHFFGLKVSLVTTVGANPQGQALINDLREKKISTSLIHRDVKADNNHSVILIYQGERTILTHHEELEYNFQHLPDSHWFYLTSLKTQDQSSYQLILKKVDSERAKLVFQPGTLQLQLGLGGLKSVLAKTDIFIANREEYELLLGQDNNRENLLINLAHQGPKICLLTENIKGALAFDGQNFYEIEAMVSPHPLDPTGAGDSFAASFVAGLINQKTIAESLQWAVINAKSVVEDFGATQNLLTKEEIIHRAASQSDIPQVQEKRLNLALR